jgi:acyl-CoA thioesterase
VPRVSDFDDATAVHLTEKPGRYTAQIDPRWAIGDRAHGGFLLALATRAALAEADPEHVHPLAVTGAFAAAAPFGPAGLEVEVLRHGRTTSVLRVRVTAGPDGRPYLEAVVTAGRLQAGEPVLPGPECPSMPSEETCILARPETGPEGTRVHLLDVVRQRFDPSTLGFAKGLPSGTGELRAWVRFADGRDADPLALTLLGDALPPPSFDVPGLRPGWVPTLQLSTFVRAEPAPGPLVARAVARSIGGGAVDETCDLWDSRGRLVSVTHQLAMVRSLS